MGFFLTKIKMRRNPYIGKFLYFCIEKIPYITA
ncbi:hypothetical protein P872_22680 [Rhodonellum psychrophilum GCM71 = DSM 17998]|uniref:Uncharacterized protein n=1 Tax=Rhodonellum psychrophilum GCM71 = DSM 17998 TaxID=1123057 RepID=U5C507_9BACT|nr:hypothetical protein P872_22680 [Rhodonellum psychrophilum GCM71 = DSM 17998]